MWCALATCAGFLRFDAHMFVIRTYVCIRFSVFIIHACSWFTALFCSSWGRKRLRHMIKSIAHRNQFAHMYKCIPGTEFTLAHHDLNAACQHIKLRLCSLSQWWMTYTENHSWGMSHFGRRLPSHLAYGTVQSTVSILHACRGCVAVAWRPSTHDGWGDRLPSACVYICV